MTKKQVYLTLLFAVLLASSLAVFAHADWGPSTFNVALGTGEALNYQDLDVPATITFLVQSGMLNATCTLTVVDGESGELAISPSTSGSIYVYANVSAFQAYFNGIPRSTAYTFTAGTNFTVSWEYISQDVTPIIVGETNTTLYFRGDAYKTYDVTGYGLDTLNTESSVTATSTGAGAVSVSYGFRVWLLRYGGSTVELTDGAPDAVVTRSSDGSGYQTGTWTPDETALMLGFDALKVTVYCKLGSGDWTAKATFLSHPLVNSVLFHQTWSFVVYTSKATGTDTTATFRWGSSTYNSQITSVGFKEPTEFEIQQWRINNNDFVGFTIGAYVDVIGPAFYLILLLIPTGTLYLRNKNLGPVLFMFVLFGGPGGVIWALVPVWAAAALDALLLIGAAVLVFKIIR